MNTTLKTILIIIGVVLVGIIAAGIVKFNVLGDDMYIEQESKISIVNDNTYLLSTDSGKTAVITYTSEDRGMASLEIEGKVYKLKVAQSGSGSRYTNDDESVTYWEHQGEATIEINGETEYQVSNIQQTEILMFTIAPQKQPCVGVGPMECLVVNGELFYDSIQDFEFEEGTEYEIMVAKTERENVPADASKYEYRRVEVLKSNKQGDPNANKYDGMDDDCNGVDDDCNGEALDDDSDGDGIADVSDVAILENQSNMEILTKNSWQWQETQYSNDDVVKPISSDDFIAQFTADGKFSSTTDCNNTFGSYSVDDNSISFGPLAATLMACMGETKEMEYGGMLSQVTSYMIADNGNLVLMLKYDSGSMIFKPVEKVTVDASLDSDVTL